MGVRPRRHAEGLFSLESDEGRGDWGSPALPRRLVVFHATVDPRDGTIHAATNNEVYGATVHRSSDRGRPGRAPRASGFGHGPDAGEDLAHRAWAPDEDGQLWLGAAPGSSSAPTTAAA